MKINERCADCLFERQKRLSDNKDYISEIREIIENRKENDTSPYLVYLFNKTYEKHFGKRASYKEINKKFNDLVLSMESSLWNKIRSSEEPLEKALLYARIGNYIDFGAMNNVDENTFLSLFEAPLLSEGDRQVYCSFKEQCKRGKSFLLIADNCGEIVLDKLFIRQLKEVYPQLDITVMVRGGEVLNDASSEDAEYIGIDKYARVITNGAAVSGTIYDMLSDNARRALDNSDVVLAKGQGNYESLSGQGRHIFYSFLCKCDLFTSKFNVPRLTGMFVEEF